MASGANLNVSYADMEQAAQQLRKGQGELEQQLQHLRNQITNLVTSGFVTDKASKAYDENYQQFTQGATKAIQALDGLAQNLETVAKGFAEADQSFAG